MPIRIEHQPSAFAVGVAGYAAGQGRARERQGKYALDLFRDNQRMQQQQNLLGQRQSWMDERDSKKDWETMPNMANIPDTIDPQTRRELADLAAQRRDARRKFGYDDPAAREADRLAGDKYDDIIRRHVPPSEAEAWNRGLTYVDENTASPTYGKSFPEPGAGRQPYRGGQRAVDNRADQADANRAQQQQQAAAEKKAAADRQRRQDEQDAIDRWTADSLQREKLFKEMSKEFEGTTGTTPRYSSNDEIRMEIDRIMGGPATARPTMTQAPAASPVAPAAGPVPTGPGVPINGPAPGAATGGGAAPAAAHEFVVGGDGAVAPVTPPAGESEHPNNVPGRPGDYRKTPLAPAGVPGSATQGAAATPRDPLHDRGNTLPLETPESIVGYDDNGDAIFRDQNGNLTLGADAINRNNAARAAADPSQRKNGGRIDPRVAPIGAAGRTPVAPVGATGGGAVQPQARPFETSVTPVVGDWVGGQQSVASRGPTENDVYQMLESSGGLVPEQLRLGDEAMRQVGTLEDTASSAESPSQKPIADLSTLPMEMQQRVRRMYETGTPDTKAAIEYRYGQMKPIDELYPDPQQSAPPAPLDTTQRQHVAAQRGPQGTGQRKPGDAARVEGQVMGAGSLAGRTAGYARRDAGQLAPGQTRTTKYNVTPLPEERESSMDERYDSAVAERERKKAAGEGVYAPSRPPVVAAADLGVRGMTRMVAANDRSAELQRRKANVQASKIRITTEAEYNRLRSGTYFTGPDGKVRRKP